MNGLKGKFRNNNKGFTLIEMLIVVAIIAILIAIAIPMVNRALESAREATDSANERAALGIAMTEVMSENKLGGTAVKTGASDKNYAYYIISSDKKGSLTATKTEAKSENFSYGKGTALEGASKAVNAGKGIMVTYDPNATTEENMFKTEWKLLSELPT